MCSYVVEARDKISWRGVLRDLKLRELSAELPGPGYGVGHGSWVTGEEGVVGFAFFDASV